MTPRRSLWMGTCAALLAVGGLLGIHVYRLEARLASLEAHAERRDDPEPGVQGRAPPTPVRPTRQTLRVDDQAARELAQRLGGELGLEQERVEKLTRFLMAWHLRAALEGARAQGEDVSGVAASHAELLRGDLKQELAGLRLDRAQLAVLSRETPGLEALLTH
ncbi:hypothetical protein [Archangium sp.]|uniref:hypothetical protein n=1 Tax=Archangium sp. TaxID=1872627 RepID=UPI003899D2D7